MNFAFLVKCRSLLQRLRSLAFKQCVYITAHCLNYIFREAKCLESFECSNIPFRDFQLVQTRTELKYLKLTQLVGLSDEDLDTIPRFHTKLEKLNLSGCHGLSDPRAVFRIVNKCKRLSYLNISSCPNMIPVTYRGRSLFWYSNENPKAHGMISYFLFFSFIYGLELKSYCGFAQYCVIQEQMPALREYIRNEYLAFVDL